MSCMDIHVPSRRSGVDNQSSSRDSGSISCSTNPVALHHIDDEKAGDAGNRGVVAVRLSHSISTYTGLAREKLPKGLYILLLLNNTRI